MKLVCFADLHGRLDELPPIPPCDAVIIAGDICPESQSRAISIADPDLMRILQTEWLRTEFAAWERTVPAERIFAVPGNHDWVSRFPEECRSEVFIDELVEFKDKRFWFTPWVVPTGPWNYELPRKQRAARFADIPENLDVLVSHSPLYGVGDLAYGKPPQHAGCPELRLAVYHKRPKHMVYGHIHEAARFGTEYRLGGTKLFHASMWGKAWKPVELHI